MLFFHFFQTLVEKRVQLSVELKNDLTITGMLHSVDQHLNMKLANVSVSDPEKYPHLLNMKNCFIRGNVIRYVHLQSHDVDTDMLQDGCRREAKAEKAKAAA